MQNEEVDVFKCLKCGYEDSSFIPSGAKHISCKKQCKDDEIECPRCHRVVKKNIVKTLYEPYMTMKEYMELVEYVLENHSFMKMRGKRIKYITHSFDTRTGSIHFVRLDNEEFAKVNENRHKNLKKWIMDYLIS